MPRSFESVKDFYKTNFESVKEFHNIFGLVSNEKPKHEIFDNDRKTVQLRLDLILEELNELRDAIKDKDMVEVGDALADILYVTYGAGVSFGINLDKAFRLVHDSNMSKLCKSEEEAAQTVDWYKHNQTEYDSPTYRKCEQDDKYWVVYNQSTGKILKSIHYSKVDLQYLNN